jgi:hypothetical protein
MVATAAISYDRSDLAKDNPLRLPMNQLPPYREEPLGGFLQKVKDQAPINPFANELVRRLKIGHVMEARPDVERPEMVVTPAMPLGYMLEDYLWTHHHYSAMDEYKVRFEKPDPKYLDKLAQATLEELTNNKRYSRSYSVATWTSNVSLAIALFTVAGVGRLLAKELSEPSKDEVGADAMDKLQEVDAILKFPLLGAYHIIRTSAIDHKSIPDEHGVQLIKHYLQDVKDGVKRLTMEPLENPHNLQLWKTYGKLEIVGNLPGYFLKHGHPVEDMEKAGGKVAHGAKEGLMHVLHAVEGSHIPIIANFAGKFAGGLEETIGALVEMKDHKEDLGNLAESQIKNSIAGIGKEGGAEVIEYARQSGNPIGRNRRAQNEMFAQALAHHNGIEQDTLKVLGAIIRSAQACADMVPFYKQLAVPDGTWAAIDVAYKNVGSPEKW